MKLQRIVANDSNTALRNVKDACGEDALIISTNKIGQKTEVIYAVDLETAESQLESQSDIVGNGQPKFDSFRSVVGSEIAADKLSSLPEMRAILNEIQAEIRSLREKLSEDLKVSSGRGPAPKALEPPKKSSSNAANKLSWVDRENQQNWSGLQVIISLRTTNSEALLQSLLFRIAESSLAKPHETTLVRVYDTSLTQKERNRPAIDVPEVISSLGFRLLMTPGHSSVEQLLQEFDLKNPVLFDLTEPSLIAYESLANFDKKNEGRVLFAINCDQRVESVISDLALVPENFRSIVLYTKEKSIDVEPLVHEISKRGLRICEIVTSIE